MDLTSLGQVIAERRIAVVGRAGEIVVSLGAPQSLKDSEYLCPFQIRGIGSEKIRYAAGIDGFQALQLAMPIIGVMLERLAHDEGVSLRWLGEEDLGFPAVSPVTKP